MVVAHRGARGRSVNAETRVRAALVAGAVAGFVAAAAGVVVRRHARPPSGAVAVVGTVTISRAELDRALAGVEDVRRDGARDPALRHHVLERLVDEALLLDRGLAQGVPVREPRVRAELTASVIDTVLAGDDPPRSEPDDAALRAFYAEHATEFSAGGRVHAARLLFGGADAETRARAAMARINGGESADVVRASADADPAPPPDGPLPEGVLGRYVGPELARALGDAPVGRAVGPVRLGERSFEVGVVRARVGAVPRPFEQVRDVVAAELRRRDDDDRLRRWLDARRREVTILRAADAP